MDRDAKGANRRYYEEVRPDERERFTVEASKVHSVELLVPWVASRLRPAARLLDIGGGAGAYASRIAREAGADVVGLDISPAMIAQRAEDPLLRENVVGDMEALPFADGSFDAALFAAALHHVPDPGPALTEAFRVLRPGGSLFAYEPSSVRARRSAPISGQEQEFRLSGRWLATRVVEVGFELDRLRGVRITLRLLRPLVPTPSLRVLHAGDAIDRTLRLVPGADRLAEYVLLAAHRPG